MFLLPFFPFFFGFFLFFFGFFDKGKGKGIKLRRWIRILLMMTKKGGSIYPFIHLFFFFFFFFAFGLKDAVKKNMLEKTTISIKRETDYNRIIVIITSLPPPLILFLFPFPPAPIHHAVQYHAIPRPSFFSNLLDLKFFFCLLISSA